MRFEVPDELFQRLRNHWAPRPLEEIERKYDAVILDGGLGTALFLTRDGRVIVDGTGWDDLGVREASRTEAFTALIIGARKTGMPDLLALLPPRPSDAHDCQECAGIGWLRPSERIHFVCTTCGGVGWIEP